MKDLQKMIEAIQNESRALIKQAEKVKSLAQARTELVNSRRN